jgi:hypothetical protein
MNPEPEIDNQDAAEVRPRAAHEETKFMNITALPTDDDKPKPAITNDGSGRLIDPYELAARLNLKMSDLNQLVNEGHLSYILVPPWTVLFHFPTVLAELQKKFSHTGDPTPLVEYEIAEINRRHSRWQIEPDEQEHSEEQPQTVS